MIFLAKTDFEIFCSAVIPSEGLTLGASRALLKHKNFDEYDKNLKNRKRRGLGGLTFGSFNKSFVVIFLAKVDFQLFCFAVISSEGLTLDASRALLRQKCFEG